MGGGGARILIGMATVVACLAAAPAVQAAFPGENGRIAFTRVSPGGQTDIYSGDASALTVVRITEDGQSDNAAYSPDGTQLAYSSGDDILIADQYGNDPQLVLSTSADVDEIDWSPDGTQLVTALTNCELDCEYDIYVLNADGTGLTNLTNSIFSELSPAWSPDGSLIAFDSIVAADQDVYAIEPDGTGLANLTEDLATPAREPDFSPDGSRIAFEGSPNSMNPDGSGKSSISTGAMPAWSPDGTRTAYGGVFQRPVTGGTQTAVGTGRDPDWQVWPGAVDPPQPGTEFPRPKGATPFLVALVTTHQVCVEPNLQHGPPLAYPSCRYTSGRRTSALTVGTPDSANGLPAQAEGAVRLDVIVGNPTTPADEADVSLHVHQRDVRYHDPVAGWPDYPGELLLTANVRMSDTFNSGEGSATVVDFPLRAVVPCAVTADAIGASCSLDTTLDAVLPGLAKERERTLLQLGQVVLHWEGPDGDPDTVEDNQPFVTQGVFVP